MKAERHKLARQAGGGFWLSAPKPFNKIGVIMGNISETGLFEKLENSQEYESEEMESQEKESFKALSRKDGSYISLANDLLTNRKVVSVRRVVIAEEKLGDNYTNHIVIKLDDGTEIWSRNIAIYNPDKDGHSFYTGIK